VALFEPGHQYKKIRNQKPNSYFWLKRHEFSDKSIEPPKNPHSPASQLHRASQMKHPKPNIGTVSEGDLGQISALTLDCGAVEYYIQKFKIHLTSILCLLGLSDDPHTIQLFITLNLRVLYYTAIGGSFLILI
jgi:hypothetical protein